MNINKEILVGLGFIETKETEHVMYKYCSTGTGYLYLEKVSVEKEFYMLYKKNDQGSFEPCGHCSNLSNLLDIMMKVNHIESVKLGKELKQQEVQAVLGIKSSKQQL